MTLEKCLWWVLGQEENSSSFINAENENNKLYKCRYKCNGEDLDCEGYVTKNLLGDEKYGKQKK